MGRRPIRLHGRWTGRRSRRRDSPVGARLPPAARQSALCHSPGALARRSADWTCVETSRDRPAPMTSIRALPRPRPRPPSDESPSLLLLLPAVGSLVCLAAPAARCPPPRLPNGCAPRDLQGPPRPAPSCLPSPSVGSLGVGKRCPSWWHGGTACPRRPSLPPPPGPSAAFNQRPGVRGPPPPHPRPCAAGRLPFSSPSHAPSHSHSHFHHSFPPTTPSLPACAPAAARCIPRPTHTAPWLLLPLLLLPRCIAPASPQSPATTHQRIPKRHRLSALARHARPTLPEEAYLHPPAHATPLSLRPPPSHPPSPSRPCCCAPRSSSATITPAASLTPELAHSPCRTPPGVAMTPQRSPSDSCRCWVSRVRTE